MTKKEIEREWQRIFDEQTSWRRVNRALNYPIPKAEVERREAFFSLEHNLRAIEQAKKKRDKQGEYFALACYYITKMSIEDLSYG